MHILCVLKHVNSYKKKNLGKWWWTYLSIFLDVPSTYLYHVATTIVNGKYMSITKHTYLGTVLFKAPMYIFLFFLFQTFHPYFRKCTGVMNRLSLGFSHLSLQSYLYTAHTINLMFCFLFSLPLPPSLPPFGVRRS